MSPSTTHNFLFTLFLIFFIITAASAFWPESTFPSNFHSLYTHHCNDVVPNSHAPNSELGIDNGYFTGGDSLFGQTPNTTALNFQRKVYFQAKYDGPILRGYLILANESAPGTTGLFSLNGHYSDSVSKLCMVGGGSVGVVLKLKYPKNSSIFDSLVTGTLEFVSGENDTDVSSLGLISILGLSQKSGYQPTFIDSLVGSDRGESLGMDSLSLEQLGGSIQSVCKLIGGFRVENYELEYESGYGNLVGGDVGYVSTMLVSETWCEDGKMQMLLRFLNSSVSEGYSFPFEPRTTLIAEGEWIDKENRMLVIACRILNFTESLTNAVVGDCSTRLDFTFPARLSLRNRARIVGHIWSNRTVGNIGFHTLSEQSTGVVVFMYEFTEYDTVKKMCDVKTRGGKGKKYPDEHSAEMNLHMVVRNGMGQTGGAHLFPLFVDGDQSSVVNMSYELIFRFTDGFNFFDKGSSDSTRVSAEGIYNRDNGYLCMIACRHAFSKDQELMENDILDCAINISLKFSPVVARKQRFVYGTIASTRKQSDPLHFEPMELQYWSERHAEKSMSRMDLENLLVLISNTLACVFVGWQLYYVKKHPDVLPFISIVMVVVLMQGHMITLLSNIQAMFVPHHSSWQNKFLVTGEWLKVSEATVCGMMLVALLLQLRLLQLTWSSRQVYRSLEGLRDSEMNVLCATLPFYISGALISCVVTVVHQIHAHVRSPLQLYTLWDNLKAYSGFVLDGFLLPQILFNLFFNSGEKTLTCAFYFGTTIIRLLPHAYDLYRECTIPEEFAHYRYYANTTSSFYSTAGNIIIPCGCLFFAAIVFLQQRLVGRCILPNRYRQTSGVYEKFCKVL